MSVTVILLAGGKGMRFGAAIPKQFLPLNGHPVALHSFLLFKSLTTVDEVRVVVDKKYAHLFDTPLIAPPGERRQDSLINGIMLAPIQSQFIAVHDAARPFVTEALYTRVLEGAKKTGAAAPGLPVASTIKEVDQEGIVLSTPPRESLRAIQTPQIIHKDLLLAGISYLKTHGGVVTDDLSLIEQIGAKPLIVNGDPKNIKITFQGDL